MSLHYNYNSFQAQIVIEFFFYHREDHKDSRHDKMGKHVFDVRVA